MVQLKKDMVRRNRSESEIDRVEVDVKALQTRIQEAQPASMVSNGRCERAKCAAVTADKEPADR